MVKDYRLKIGDEGHFVFKNMSHEYVEIGSKQTLGVLETRYSVVLYLARDEAHQLVPYLSCLLHIARPSQCWRGWPRPSFKLTRGYVLFPCVLQQCQSQVSFVRTPTYMYRLVPLVRREPRFEYVVYATRAGGSVPRSKLDGKLFRCRRIYYT